MTDMVTPAGMFTLLVEMGYKGQREIQDKMEFLVEMV